MEIDHAVLLPASGLIIAILGVSFLQYHTKHKVTGGKIQLFIEIRIRLPLPKFGSIGYSEKGR